MVVLAPLGCRYAAGKLTASCPGGGGVKATRTFVSAKAPAKLLVTADRSSILAYRGDLSYVTVTVVDADETPVPEARVEVSFAVTGAYICTELVPSHQLL